VVDLFRFPTVGALARRIEQGRGAAQPADADADADTEDADSEQARAQRQRTALLQRRRPTERSF